MSQAGPIRRQPERRALDSARLAPLRYRWRRRGLILRGLLLALASAGYLWWRSCRLVVAVARRAPNFAAADTWLVPGHRLRGDELSPAYARRLRRAARLWRPGQRWVLSGRALDADSRSEALAGYGYLRDLGLPAGAEIVLDQCARDSVENLSRLPVAWRRSGSIGLVSNRWHLARCLWLARELGIDLKPCAAERHWRPDRQAWFCVAREGLALLALGGAAVCRVSDEALLGRRPLRLGRRRQ